MTESDFQKKLDEASKTVESWPNWKKNSLSNSFKSRNAQPREVVETIQAEAESPPMNKKEK